VKILLLEDDYIYRISVCEYLQSLGYEVDGVSDGEQACAKVANTSYHLLILDIKVPEISGLDVLKYVRDLEISTPIIMMTSLTDIENIEKGYKFGCNEYLKKPFELAELRYRIQEIMRRYYGSDDGSVVIDGKFCYKSGIVNSGNDEINLSAIERKIVDFLLQNTGKFSSINDIKVSVWDDRDIDDADIRMHIRKIRQKTSSEFIISIRGLGYKINV